MTQPNLEVAEVTKLPIDDICDAAGSGHQHYDLSLDGSKFLMVKHGRRVLPRRIRIIDNWSAKKDVGTME